MAGGRVSDEARTVKEPGRNANGGQTGTPSGLTRCLPHEFGIT